MSRLKPLHIFMIFLGFLPACGPTPVPDLPYTPGFFYLSTSPNAPAPQRGALVISDSPAASPRQQIPLPPPADCSLFDLHPAPVGRWILVEWECPFGPTTEALDTVTGQGRFLLSDTRLDNRFLAWQPDGRSIYLKVGTLSVPQTLRVDVASGTATELPIPPFVYDLTVSPDGRRVLYSLSHGIGFGSETWLAGPGGENGSQLLVDAENIIGFARYSPNGGQIAYINIPDSSEQNPTGELWVMDSGGFNARFMAKTDAGRRIPPVWSQDATKIAFSGRDSQAESPNLSIVDLTTGEVSTFAATPVTAPVWDAGGVFFSAAGDDTINVWFYEIATARADIVFPGACCAGWIR